MASIQPTTGILEPIRKQCLTWNTILGELIDNSFDAGAKRVEIVFDGKHLTVQDDGHGCPDVLQMLRIGGRQQHAATRLGRYGIGAKDAMISAADGVHIVSVCNGMKQTAGANWKQLERRGSWDIEDPSNVPTTDPSGTRIIMTQLRSDRLRSSDRLIHSLSVQYSPAISSGRQIVLKPSSRAHAVTVPLFRMPTLEHQVTKEFTVGGRLVNVSIGIVPDGHVVEHSGLMVAYDFRVILSGFRKGFGDKPTPGLFGIVSLGDGWELTKNKNNIAGNLDALGDAIYEHCRDTIDAASRRHETIVFSDVEKDVNRILEDLMADSGKPNRKAKRKPKENESGAIIPMSSGRRHHRAESTQDGSTFSEGITRKGGLRVSWESRGNPGPASVFQDGVVYLNRDIPIVAEAANDKKALAIHAIYAAAAHLASAGNQREFFGEAETLVSRMAAAAGRLLSGLGRTEESDALSAEVG